MNAARSLLKLVRPTVRHSSARGIRSLEHLKELQKLYQADDGVPVYLKRGFRDKILYQITAAGVIVGTLCSLYN
ncbi:cytochrome c oxidase subunit VIIa 2-like, partial [Tropilaelaps mercedesae]